LDPRQSASALNRLVIQHTWVIGCRQQLYIQKWGQTAANRDMITTDSL